MGVGATPLPPLLEGNPAKDAAPMHCARELRCAGEFHRGRGNFTWGVGQGHSTVPDVKQPPPGIAADRLAGR